LAVVAFAKAQFMFSKTIEFVDLSRGEGDIMKLAESECKNAIEFYGRIKHRMGEAESIKLLMSIQQKLDPKPTRQQVNDQKNKMLQKMKEEKELQHQLKSFYLERTKGIAISILIEPSNLQMLPPDSKEAK